MPSGIWKVPQLWFRSSILSITFSVPLVYKAHKAVFKYKIAQSLERRFFLKLISILEQCKAWHESQLFSSCFQIQMRSTNSFSSTATRCTGSCWLSSSQSALLFPINIVRTNVSRQVFFSGLNSSCFFWSVLNVISWIRFDNANCDSTMGEQGTCYTARECQSLNGVTAGVCAAGETVPFRVIVLLYTMSLGFGVCCVLMHTCGGKATVNNTYLVNPKYPSPFNQIGQCTMTVEKVNTDICQIR